jgi:pentatricopeptide repeat protein
MRSLGIKPSTKTYNAMMGCLGRCRKPDLMLKAHKQMLDEGIKPDDTTRHFLGKFGPPGTSQSSQAWGSGNLMGQRVELKYYGRGAEPGEEAPGDSGPVYNPREKYRKEGVLLAMKREDSGWVRRDRERQLAEERRQAQVKGEEGMREGEESGLRNPVKVLQPGEGRGDMGEKDEHESGSVSEEEEGLEEGYGVGESYGGRPVEARGQTLPSSSKRENVVETPEARIGRMKEGGMRAPKQVSRFCEYFHYSNNI